DVARADDADLLRAPKLADSNRLGCLTHPHQLAVDDAAVHGLEHSVQTDVLVEGMFLPFFQGLANEVQLVQPASHLSNALRILLVDGGAELNAFAVVEPLLH